ncbi:hypothetical protein DXG01_009497 [Tephrocybe rancida]|nr:hypothetical protein DXG01_009497 [Tephrocybe rancida]
MRVNFTSYDVRRSQDSFNPSTSHRDVMVLSGSASGHQFRYARIIRIFHVNAMYSGPRWRSNYTTRPLQVLWVRWFEVLRDASVDVAWAAAHPELDCVQFKPIAQPGAFGFLDPTEVLRGCHLVPRVARGPCYEDGRGHSPYARDGDDWLFYYVNRFVDRDMLMRYHWGLGVGHVYSHNLSSPESEQDASSRKESEATITGDMGNLHTGPSSHEIVREDVKMAERDNMSRADSESDAADDISNKDSDPDSDLGDSYSDGGDDGDANESDPGSTDELYAGIDNDDDGSYD